MAKRCVKDMSEIFLFFKAPEPIVDNRSLYDRLKEQKDKKELDFEETHKLKNMIRGLDDDEVDFLDMVDKNRLEAEKRQKMEELKELKEFREKSATLHSAIDLKERLSADLNGSTKSKPSQIMGRPSQKSILSGMIKKRKTSESNETQTKKPRNAVEVTAVLSKAPNATANSLKCVAILPGIGSYKDTSDSNDSSDAEEIAPGMYDLAGRRLKKLECDE